ncbi:LOW QUALITY PROTEIN: cadherin-AgCad1-like [Aphomia sociella]
MQRYMFTIRAPEGETRAISIALQIVNIDDNDPIIRLFDTCQVEELGGPRLTDCVYEVWDADGFISTSAMTYRIDSNRDDDEIFYIDSHIQQNVFYMNMTIGLLRALNFDTNALHIFTITAMDSKPNTHTVTMMVQVINVEHRPPRWIEIFAVQQFDEKTNQTFEVQAVDGDTGIDKPIYYKLRTDPEDTFFSIETIEGGRNGAIFHVSPIDRDTLERDVFQLSIIAYKYDNASYATEARVVIIVNDVNDQRPVPFQTEYYIEIMEETPLTLDFPAAIGFHDRDLGEHAQYQVHLEDIYPGAASAFYIAPEVGYQRQTFIMGTINHTMLDYEVEEKITLYVIATDMNNTDFTGNATIFINLINWNDEEPIFNETSQVVSFNETEGQGFYVATVRAFDRDIDDRVVHTLMGNTGGFLEIDSFTGEIYVSANDSFDYHRQNEIFVQIRADDTLGEPYNTATSQLVIQLLDINNTPPTLRLPRGSPHVEENVPEGYIITNEIHATDPDTTADLIFEIDWETSYATKQGRETDPVEFHECVYIETLFPEVNNRGNVIGRVVVREIRHNVTIDYEEFEVLYLTVRVRDLNTLIGDPYDESTFTITIVDMNDNMPLWASGTLEQQFRVTEMAASGTVVGSVLATDIDGPLYNQVRYTIRPREDTPEGLMKIDFYTGQIQVDANEAIDADIPPRFNLYYTIIASDQCYAENRTECPPDETSWSPEGNIIISITDTNNKWPQAEIEKFNTTVWIYENATHGDDVVKIISSDLDRDELYHTVSYQINYQVNPRLRNFFSVDLESGQVYVDYTTNEVLDRDGDEPRHTIFLTLTDNFLTGGDGRRNQNETEVLVILLDVNDNKPELPDNLTWTVSESFLEGTILEDEITAPDRDEPDTDNSRVRYDIINQTVTDRPGFEHPDLFDMIQVQNVSGLLVTATDLKGYWGTYAIHIRACDHGIPRLCDDAVYEIEVEPYNFHAPVFVFPSHLTTIRLARERAVTNGLLAMVNGEFLDRVEATDKDGLHAGLVTFDISGNGDNTSNRRGTDPGPLSTTSTLHVIFVPTQGDPIFDTNTYEVAFFEKEQGLEERFQLPIAEDPKNYRCDIDDYCLDIYYRIADGNDEGFFGLDPVENILYLERELDRNESSTHTIVIAVSNSLTPGPALASSMITVSVTVREANPRPNFVSDHYTAGISTSDSINRELLTVQATHTEDAEITYSIDNTSMVVDSSLEAVRDSAFSLHPTSGVLTLTMQPTVSMHGMFEFKVVATDTAGAEDTAAVTVYLVSSLNRVIFKFWNSVETIEDNRNFIAQTFSAGFSMICNIDQITPSSDDAGVAQHDVTDVRAHFIRDNQPVLADEIEELRSDTLLLRSIQTTLSTELLVLQDFVTENSPIPGQDTSLTIIYVLAALSALLAFMFIVLVITFVIRTKALNRRLEALSMTKYGSVDSGLNRAGLAPGTNKHAVEGSNPIWNESIKAPDFDAISDVSDSSDLVGIEDMMQFNYDGTPQAGPSHAQDFEQPRDTVTNHNNNFGFNTSPFSAEFTRTNFNR